MLKKILVTSLLLGLLGIPSSLRAVQSVTGVPQDPASVGYLNLHKRHPDGYEGPDEFNRVYSSEEALQRMTQMRGILESFRQLTEKTRNRLSESELRSIGNTSREMQTIGFHNIPLTIEGTILKQEYQLKQLKFQMAQLRRERAEATPQELDRARTEYADATKNLQIFWDTKLPTD
jgi:hypothetical protein